MSFGEFTCSVCGETFDKAISDEEALEAMRKDIGRGIKPEDKLCVVCDDCHYKLMDWFEDQSDADIERMRKDSQGT